MAARLALIGWSMSVSGTPRAGIPVPQTGSHKGPTPTECCLRFSCSILPSVDAYLAPVSTCEY